MHKLRLAKIVAEQGHKNQTYGDKDYFYHCEQVANLLSNDLDKTIAYLHDILEDTDISRDELGEWFGYHIVNVVSILTRRSFETYFDYIVRVSKSEDAKRIKIADLKVNITNQTSQSLKERYEKALKLLTIQDV